VCAAMTTPEKIERTSGDLPITHRYFDLVDATERHAYSLRELIVAIRQAQREGNTNEEVVAILEVPPDQWTGVQAAFAAPVRDCS
jgi:hypothetical protein